MANYERYLPPWMTEKPVINKTKEFIQFKGQIKQCIYSNILASYAEEILTKIESSKINEVVYGFDMEWPVTFDRKSKKTALIQICTDHSTCYLFHVYHIIKLPSIFVNLINHPRVRWSGVCIKNDFLKLGRDFNIDVSGAVNRIIDLGTYTNQVLYFDSSIKWSMANLVKRLLKKDVNKDVNIRMSNWDNINLDQNQCMYAATDAFISLILYEHLRRFDKEDELQIN
ncbi:Werner Syndrome-like exonuclease [Melanaphis sacchari]|uniref:Werner Syndrome-like exonuclease n=1 Tax=Melanaphis sacchari TaxID=742174 RepID=UPI000DC15048|nr:Werner Syndrome-like exonuclease [Melanaphis sacchari]XP_025202056.1 Werner Syndrome-like exonuclease [Melanaphis sacchari]XP_025202057.1 Werner Syndrome-like exonuclease [Melanaphis sacchari]XP_025202058.1 Werner Syndrome-like exonuclease [Melanaphis sacchari]